MAASGRSGLVLITPAHDEAATLPAVVEAVVAQTLRPDRWIIVDDGSTDHTAELAEKAAADHDFVELLRHTPRRGHRGFARKARAVAAGWEAVADPDVRFVGNLDADALLPVDFCERVVAAFEAEPRLGVTGARYRMPVGRGHRLPPHPAEHVPGPAQIFRREVWDGLDGYWPLPHGGLDTAANYGARSLGWTTRVLDGLVVDHQRTVGTGGGTPLWRAEYRKGRQDWDLGADPWFEAFKLVRRVTEPPLVIGAAARTVGYLHAVLAGRLRLERRAVPNAFATALRTEQRRRVEDVVGRLPVVGSRRPWSR